LFLDKELGAFVKEHYNGLKIGQDQLYISELIHKENRKVALTKALIKQNLYIKNLPPDVIKDEELFDFFNKNFGKVKNAKVYVMDSGEKNEIGDPIIVGKGFGFICFES